MLIDQANRYWYARLNPINLVDLQGTQPGPAPGREGTPPAGESLEASEGERLLYDISEKTRLLEDSVKYCNENMSCSPSRGQIYEASKSFNHPKDVAAGARKAQAERDSASYEEWQKSRPQSTRKIDPVTDRVGKFLTEDQPELGRAVETLQLMGSVFMLGQDAKSLINGLGRPTLTLASGSAESLAEIPTAPTGAVVRPGQVAASAEFTLGQRAMRILYTMTGGKLSGAGPSNVSGMAIPFSRFNSSDPVLRALESSPPGTYIGPKGAVLSEMPSQAQFAKITRIHGTEFSLTYDPMTQQSLLSQGGPTSVKVHQGYWLAHSHPMADVLPSRYSGVQSWAPSGADVDIVGDKAQQSSVIVMSSGEAYTFGPLKFKF